MSSNKQFDKFSKSMTAGLGISDFDSIPQPTAKPAPAPSPSAEDAAAVKAAQNEARNGRGKKKGDRKLVSFNLDIDTVNRIDDIHYQLRKPKQELYEEAFADLLAKYIEI